MECYKNKTWWDDQMKETLTQRRRVYNDLIKANENGENKLKAMLYENYKALNRLFKSLARKKKLQEFEKKEQMILESNDPKLLWSTIKDLSINRKVGESQMGLRNEEGEIVHEPQLIVRIWKETLMKLYSGGENDFEMNS